MSLATAATLLAATTIGAGAMVSPAVASATDLAKLAINGTYLATSNGEWAKTNDSYHDEATIRSTWTITSSCSDPLTCSGTVTSDQGWTAELSFRAQEWYVHRDLPNWEPCFTGPPPGMPGQVPDGTAATGRQTYRFYFWDPSLEQIIAGSPILVGEDETTGPSGACGWNKHLVIRMPFKLVKIA